LEAEEKLATVRKDIASTSTHDLRAPLPGALETLKAFQKNCFGTGQVSQQSVLRFYQGENDRQSGFLYRDSA